MCVQGMKNLGANDEERDVIGEGRMQKRNNMESCRIANDSIQRYLSIRKGVLNWHGDLKRVCARGGSDAQPPIVPPGACCVPN